MFYLKVGSCRGFLVQQLFLDKGEAWEAMELRRSFLQTVKDSTAQPAAKHGACASSERRRFFSAISGGSSSRDAASPSGVQSNEDHPISVSFSLTSLLDFKDSVQSLGAYKKGREPARKRPNYDNSRRIMFSNPEFRRKHLISLEFRFVCLFVFRGVL